MKKLELNDIEWVVESKLDPMGRVFKYNNEYYRAVYPQNVEFVKGLFSNGIIYKLINDSLLIETNITEFELPNYGLILHHKKIPFQTYAPDWPKEILRDAAKVVIKLNQELLKYNLATIDYHSHNIQLTENSKPVWIDFGSIVPQERVKLEWANREFVNYFVNPLILYSKGNELDDLCRHVLLKNEITSEELAALCGLKIKIPIDNRKVWLNSIAAWLEELSLPKKKGAWSDYYKRDNEPFCLPEFGPLNLEPNTRCGIAYQLLNKYNPRKVLDVGCNAGVFSVLSAEYGADVCSIDYDEGALETFYFALKNDKRNLPISILKRDITDRKIQKIYPLKAEFVFCLAITHHLRLTQNCSFNLIAQLFSAYCTNVLVTEFMPNGLGINGEISPNPLPLDYTLENFEKAFQRFFNNVYHIEYPQTSSSKRIFVVCEERNEQNNIL
ncbi:MAG: class I SAM-dependent methyltransferase [bacterium]|nr:class I SAM-dependent methyltransferase [bacterium]